MQEKRLNVSRWAVCVCAAACMTLAGCNGLEGLVDGSYSGAPLLAFQVDLEGAASDFSSSVLPLVLWSNTGTTTALDFRSQSALGRYTMELKQTLPDEAYQRIANLGKAPLVGRIVLFEDLNRDGTWNVGAEPFRGGSNTHIILFHNDPDLEVPQRYRLARLRDCDEFDTSEPFDMLTAQEIQQELVSVILVEHEEYLEDIDCDQVIDDICFNADEGLSEECQSLYSNECEEQEDSLAELFDEHASIDPADPNFKQLQETFEREVGHARTELSECYGFDIIDDECEGISVEECETQWADLCPEGYLIEAETMDCVCEDMTNRHAQTGLCVLDPRGG